MQNKGYQELTDKDNEPILGTLTHESWVGLTVEDIASRWYDLTTDLSALLTKKNPAEEIVPVARFSSGSIGGASRGDLKDALVGSPAQQSSLGVSIMNGNQAPPPRPENERPRPRGF